MIPSSDDSTGSLERARENLYDPGYVPRSVRTPLPTPGGRTIPHRWIGSALPTNLSYFGKKHVRLAGTFFSFAFVFFILALLVAGYFIYFGGNSVSVDKVAVDIQGPSTISGGDTVPLALTITNKNATAIQNATIEIDFPDNTRNADNVLNSYPRYTENLGTIASGATVTRSVRVILFGGSGQALSLPVAFSYGTSGSNAVFVKKSSYALTVSSTPLSVSVQTPPNITSGKPFTFTLIVNSNATVPLNNVVLTYAAPFGYSVNSSSVPLNNSSFLLGTLAPNTSKTITLTGTLLGQDNNKSIFHFTVGTASTPQNQALAVTYMTQETDVTIAAPFITATLTINGDTSANKVLSPGTLQNVTVSYTNTLSTTINNATVEISMSGSAVDYSNIKTSDGFYRSSDHTIVFSKDTDSTLKTLAPGASGIGTFTFYTLSATSMPSSPAITFTIAVSGTRAGETDVIQTMDASATKTAKVMTTVVLSASALHNSGALVNSGPIPPKANQATTYTISWSAQNQGSPIAGGTVSAVLPSYVTYTGVTDGDFSYNTGSHTVSWNVGDLSQKASTRGSFQVSITPSTSQANTAPVLTGPATFSGYDRFAGAQISATTEQVTTDTPKDTGYVSSNGTVQ